MRDVDMEPPRSKPFDVAATALAYVKVIQNVSQLMANGEYAKARDFLQIVMLVMDLDKRMRPNQKLPGLIKSRHLHLTYLKSLHTLYI